MTLQAEEGSQALQAEVGNRDVHREHNVFLAKTTSKDYTVRLLYYAVAVCIYNAWCIFNNTQ